MPNVSDLIKRFNSNVQPVDKPTKIKKRTIPKQILLDKKVKQRTIPKQILLDKKVKQRTIPKQILLDTKIKHPIISKSLYQNKITSKKRPIVTFIGSHRMDNISNKIDGIIMNNTCSKIAYYYNTNKILYLIKYLLNMCNDIPRVRHNNSRVIDIVKNNLKLSNKIVIEISVKSSNDD